MSNYQYTYQNHYKFRWFSNFEEAHLTPREGFNFELDFGKAKNNEVRNWGEACRFAAQDIIEDANSLNQQITVLLSGGIDSEIAARCFIELGYTPKLAFTKFKHKLNDYDYKYAKRFADKHDLKLYEFELDAIEFMVEKNYDYMIQHKMMSPQLPYQLWLIDQIDEYPVVCGGDIVCTRENESGKVTKNEWRIRANPGTSTCERHLRLHGRPGAPLFHFHTPDQAYWMFKDEMFQLFLKHAYSAKMLTNKYFKPFIYEKYFPGTEMRQKRTGIEKFQYIDDNELRPYWTEKHKNYNPAYWIKLDKYMEKLSPL